MSAVTLLVFARGLGLALRAPGFSHPSVPPAVRVALALALAMAVAPGITGVRAPAGVLLLAALAGEVLLARRWARCGAALRRAYAAGRAIDEYVGVQRQLPNRRGHRVAGFAALWSATFWPDSFARFARRADRPRVCAQLRADRTWCGCRC